MPIEIKSDQYFSAGCSQTIYTNTILNYGNGCLILFFNELGIINPRSLIIHYQDLNVEFPCDVKASCVILGNSYISVLDLQNYFLDWQTNHSGTNPFQNFEERLSQLEGRLEWRIEALERSLVEKTPEWSMEPADLYEFESFCQFFLNILLDYEILEKGNYKSYNSEVHGRPMLELSTPSFKIEITLLENFNLKFKRGTTQNSITCNKDPEIYNKEDYYEMIVNFFKKSI